MSTQKIYFQNPYQTEFIAKVMGIREIEGKTGIVLDRTVFYPTGGGQPHDRGTLDEYKVIDVREQEDEVLHIIEGEYQGERQLKGVIDWPRRFDHMQQHLAQHIFSAILLKHYNAKTIAFHLGTEYSTIDVVASELPTLEKLEDLVNEVIVRNLQIETEFIAREELPPETYKKVPNNDPYIRMVNIPGLDQNACCGTHPIYTSEIGLFKIIDIEPYKGNHRFYFLAGWRAIRRFQQVDRMVCGLAGVFKTNINELDDRLQAVRTENDQLKRELRTTKQELIAWEAKAWQQRYEEIGPYHVRIHTYLDRPFQEIKDLAKTIIEGSNEIVIFATKQPKAQVIAACSADVKISMLEIIEYLTPFMNGKGGGSRVFAQLGGDGEGLEEALQTLMSWFKDHTY